MNKVLIRIAYVLFFVLLLWPAYTMLSYMFLSSEVRMITSILAIVLEVLLGAFCLWWTWKTKESRKRGGFIALMSIIGFFYAIYLISILYIFVLQR